MSFDRIEQFCADSIWGFLAVCKAVDEITESGALIIAVDVMETKKDCATKLSKDEETYLAGLPSEKRQWLVGELTRMEKVMHTGADSVPSRFRILMAQLPDSAKAVALSRLEAMLADPGSAESAKLKRWMDGLLQVPFGKYAQPMVGSARATTRCASTSSKRKRSLRLLCTGTRSRKKRSSRFCASGCRIRTPARSCSASAGRQVTARPRFAGKASPRLSIVLSCK
jgi:hypothetical protein